MLSRSRILKKWSSASKLKRKAFFLYFLLLAFTLLVPLISYADDDFFKVCWTEEQCYQDYGAGDSNPRDKYEFVPADSLPADDICKKNEMGRCYYKPQPIFLQVKIPAIKSVRDLIAGSDYVRNQISVDDQQISTVKGFPAYLAILYTYFTAVAGIVAVAMIAYGGYQWMVAGGNAERISQAKSTIQGAVIGLILALGSYVLLEQINSRLVVLKGLRVERIRPILLARTCNELESIGVNDLVTDEDENGVTPDQAKCGEKYFSKSNPSQQCMGTSCDDFPSKPYCLADESLGEWMCVSESEVKDKCNKISDVRKNPTQCEIVDNYYERTKVPFVCRLTVDNFNLLLNLFNRFHYGSGSALASWLAEKVGIIDTDEVIRCKSYPLVVDPLIFLEGGLVRQAERINCQEGAPLCWNKSENKRRKLCVNQEEDPRVGKGYNRMCVTITRAITNNETLFCSSTEPPCSCEDRTVCSSLKLSECKYQEVEQTDCDPPCTGNDKCWRFIGLTE